MAKTTKYKRVLCCIQELPDILIAYQEIHAPDTANLG